MGGSKEVGQEMGGGDLLSNRLKIFPENLSLSYLTRVYVLQEDEKENEPTHRHIPPCTCLRL